MNDLPPRAYHLPLDCSVGTLEKIIALPFHGVRWSSSRDSRRSLLTGESVSQEEAIEAREGLPAVTVSGQRLARSAASALRPRRLLRRCPLQISPRFIERACVHCEIDAH